MLMNLPFAAQIAKYFLHYGNYHVSLIPEAYIYSKVIASTIFAVASV